MTTKILFVHDSRFYEHDNKLYSGGSFSTAVWSRYLAHFDKLSVLARIGGKVDGAQADEMALASATDVDFTLCKGISGVREMIVNHKKTTNLVKKLVANHDAVIARLGSQLGLLAVDEAIRQSKPYAIELVGCSWDAYWHYGTLIGKLHAPIAFWRVRRAVRNAPMVLYVTEQFLQRRYPTNAPIAIACSDVEVPIICDTTLAKRLDKIKQNKQRITFGSVGSLAGRFKGFDVAFKALSSIAEILPDFEFRILGPGDADPWMEDAKAAGLKNKVHFDGVLPSGEAVFNWLDDIDIYLHPSYREGLPRAVIEAMSRGCPVLATSVAGTPELISGAYLFNAGDAKRLGELILQVAENKERQLSMAKANFERAKDYSRDDLSKKQFKFFSQLNN